MFETLAVDASSFANSIASDLVSAWPKVMASLSTSQFSPTGLTCNDFGLFSMNEDLGDGGVLIRGRAQSITWEGGAFPLCRMLTTTRRWLQGGGSRRFSRELAFVWSSLCEQALAALTVVADDPLDVNACRSSETYWYIQLNILRRILDTKDEVIGSKDLPRAILWTNTSIPVNQLKAVKIL